MSKPPGLPSSGTPHWHTPISWSPFNKGPMTSVESWGFVFGSLHFYVWWWVWMTTQIIKDCCPIIACVMFGHGCQLTFSSAHNWKVERVGWREWNFGCLVIKCYWTIFLNHSKKRPSKCLVIWSVMANSRIAMFGYKVVLVQSWRNLEGKGQGTMWL